MSVSIKIGGDDDWKPFKPIQPPRQSLTRQWNRLSRLQKSICYLVVVCVLILFLYKLKKSQDTGSTLTSFKISSASPPAVVTRSPDRAEDGQLPDRDWQYADSQQDKEPEDQNAPLPIDYEQVKKELDEELRHKRIEQEPDDVNDEELSFTGPSNSRQEAVVKAFKHSWKAYKEYAWGKDELMPLSKQSHKWFDVGLTLIDSLDTMYIMGLSTGEHRWAISTTNLHSYYLMYRVQRSQRMGKR